MYQVSFYGIQPFYIIFFTWNKPILLGMTVYRKKKLENDRYKGCLCIYSWDYVTQTQSESNRLMMKGSSAVSIQLFQQIFNFTKKEKEKKFTY